MSAINSAPDLVSEGEGSTSTSLDLVLAYFLALMLLLFRVVSSYVGVLQSPLLTMMAVALVFGILRVGGVFGLAITFYDMTAWGNLFSTDQFGLAGYFKLIDLEVLLIIITSAIYYKKRSIKVEKHISRLFTGVLTIGTIYAFLSLALFHSDVGGVLRIFRTFAYASLVFYIPAFVQSKNDVRALVKYLLVFGMLNSILFLLQIAFPRLPVYLYAQLGRLEPGINQVRIYGVMLLLPIAIVPVFFPYLLQKGTTLASKIAFLTILAAILAQAGRALLATTFLSLVIVVYLVKHPPEILGRILKILAVAFAILLASSVVDLNTANMILTRYELRSANVLSDLQMQGGDFTTRALQFLAVPKFLGPPERLLFGAGFLYKSPEEYGPMYPFIYAFNYATGDYQEAGILTRDVGIAAHNELRVSIFFPDNGWAGIFSAMGCLGLLLYVIFISSLIRYAYRSFKNSKGILARSIFAGLFSMFLLDPISFFISAGYLDPNIMLHLVLYLSLAMRVSLYDDYNLNRL